MNLKRRLIIANLATVVIPLVITVLFALGYFYVYEKLFGVDISFQGYQQFAELKLELVSEKSVLRQNPEVVAEESFHRYLRERLAGVRGEFIVFKNDTQLAASIPFNKIDVAKILDAVADYPQSFRVDIGNSTYTVDMVEFAFKDGQVGRIVFLAPMGRGGADPLTLVLFLGIVFGLAFIATNAYVLYRFSAKVLKPLNQLQIAAAEISQGNLDYQIVEDGDQEIQALCRDLELMRIKLKELIRTQLKYEDNRKMLVSSISHDLKTPVTSIKGYVEGILDGVANTPEKRERYLRTIYTKAEQLDKMIDDLLLYAKLDLNQLPFNFERVNIAEYLKHCLAESEPELEQDGIKLEFVDELSRPYFIQIDRERMKRVLMNILDNSRKYMHREDGRITVFLRETKTSIIIEVRDNGPGIKESELPYIFERFYRSDPARTEIKGSGLGLAIAKQLVEGHQGRIWAISNEGEGTSIIISLSKI